MHSLKNFAVKFFEKTHGFEREEQTLLGRKIVAKGHRHTPHHHIFGCCFDPLRKGRLKRVAVWAAVPKKFQHFNLAGLGFGGNRAIELDVVFARCEFQGALRKCRGRQ